MNPVDMGMMRYNQMELNHISSRGARSLAPATEDSKLKDACRDFEAIFIKQMLDSMRKTVQKTGLIDGGMAENIFEDFLYDEYSKVMAKTGSFGIQDLLYRQFKDGVSNS
jgi:flagellar protein FlgJ